MLRVTIWNENLHEKTSKEMAELYPDGLHGMLADIVRPLEDVEIRTATLDQPECGLTDEVLDNTDVIIWWGHMAHAQVPDEIVRKVVDHVLLGMGMIVLHSGHHSKPFKMLMGTSCSLRWRDDDYERLWCVNPGHPIAKGIPANIELGIEEMYGEFFDIPQPDEVVFTGWFRGGEVFRSGCCWTRGAGKIFYFQPGHETNRSFLNPHVQQVIRNAVQWAAPVHRRTTLDCFPFGKTTEELVASGADIPQY